MTNETDKAVGTQLQSLRVYAGLGIACAAERLSIGAEELGAYEAGAQRPQPSVLLAMAECYEVPPSRMFALLAASHNT